MIFESKKYSIGTMFLFFITFIAISSKGALSFSVKPDEIATVVGKAFTYKLPVELVMQNDYSYKLHVSGGESLPSWLTFDKNLLIGVPSHHDKGSHVIQLDVINTETNKTVELINLLTIHVVQFDEDLNHYNILQPSPIAQPSAKNESRSPLDCLGNMPFIVATIVFDLSARKLSGAKRVELLKSVSEWSDVDVENLRFLPGKGDKTAFHLKDVILLTAGPGWVKDAQERGVCVSWKIGCGVNIAGIPFVMHLKSASENGAFQKDLGSPVVAWHVTHGMLKHRQAIRVRRQAAGQTPQPTSAFVPPTVVFAPRSATGVGVGTPTIAPSPTVHTVTPTSTLGPGQPPIVEVNTPPKLINSLPNLTAEINIPFSYPIPVNTFVDKEDGDTPKLILELHYPNGNALPDDLWLKLDNEQKLYGMPSEKDLGTISVALIAQDKAGLRSELDVIKVMVVRKSEPPRLINHIDLIKVFVGQPLKFTIPYDTFWDDKDGNTNKLTLSMFTVDSEPLPQNSWVTFDAPSQTIYALPRAEQVGKPEFYMVATDSDGKKARDAFEFHVFEVEKPLYHKFGLVLNDPSFSNFAVNVMTRVNLCIFLGEYFGSHFNMSYKDIRVRRYEDVKDVDLKWSFANIATDVQQAYMYKKKYMIGESGKPVQPFENKVKSRCSVEKDECSVTNVSVWIMDPNMNTTPDPNVLGRDEDRGGGTWWKYTIIPAFVVAGLVFIIGLIVIICIRCRRKSKLKKSDKVVFLYRKKPAVFREEYPIKEVYGNQPLMTASEKSPLPPPAYPRSSTPTDDANVTLLSDCSPSYQPPSFDSGNEQQGNAHVQVPSYRLPPPYVAP